MIDRIISHKVLEAAQKMPVIAVTGPRQSGKSTLVKAIFPDYTYTNLEDIEQRSFAQEDPKGFLRSFGTRTIIDEIQRVPELLSYIQVTVDQENLPGQYVLSGSQNLLLMEAVTQSLAGRVAIFNLLPFSLEEIGDSKFRQENYEDYIVKGFYPRIYDQDLNANTWLLDYIQTYVERDLRQLMNVSDLGAFRQFLEICAGRTGQLVNLSEIGNILGISYQTVNKWIGVLQASFIVHLLRPYHKNYDKRIVKSPKLYFYDTGLACALMNIRTPDDFNRHFAKGALFENFVINEIMKNNINRNLRPGFYFWSAAGKHEVDLLIDQGLTLIPVEIKSARTINQQFFDGLVYFQEASGTPPEKSVLIYGGDENQSRSKARVISWKNLEEIGFNNFQ